jgi:hypothetical protein
MRRFGVDMSAAAVNAKALAMGLKATEKALTQADKVQARYAILLEQTTTAQGDAARTADTFAGKQRRLGAEVEDLKAKVGTFLMGAADGFLSFLGGVVDVIDGPSGASANIRDLTGTIVMLRAQTDALTKGDPFERMANDMALWNEQLRASEELYRNDTWFKWVAALGPDTLRNFGKAGAETMADVRALAQGVIDAGGSFAEFASIVRQKVAPSYNVLTSAWTGSMSAIESTGDAAVTVTKRVRRSLDAMFMTMNQAKEPWKESWKQLAAWAKDPFSEKRFEDWLGTRVKKAMANARKSFGAEKQRWLEIARAYRWAIKNNLTDPTETDLRGLIAALRLIRRLGRVTGTTRMASEEKVAGRASGGPVSAGTTYLVGEKGPELVTMGSNGHVTPNHALGGATYNINVHIAPGGDMVEAGRQMVNAIRAYERRSGAVWRSR